MKRRILAFLGSVLLPLGGLYFPFALVGGVLLTLGVKSFLEDRQGLFKPFALGVALAILGGYWAKGVLDEEGLRLLKMLPTAVVSTVGLYLQFLSYEYISRRFGVDNLFLGGVMLVIGSSTFWFYVGFIPLVVGTVLIAYSFWRLKDV